MRSAQRMHQRAGALRRFVAAGIVLALCHVAGVAHAQSGKGAYVGAWSIAGNLGYAVPNTDQYEDVLTWRFGVGYSPTPYLEIDLEAGMFSTQVTQPEPDGVPTHDIASGQLDVIPACLTLRLRLPLQDSMASLVLLGGAGYYFVDYTMAETPRQFYSSSGVEGLPDQAVQDDWGFHAGAGLEYALSGWFSVGIEARYLVLSPPVSGTTKDGFAIGGSLDLNTWLFTGGIKVAF